MKAWKRWIIFLIILGAGFFTVYAALEQSQEEREKQIWRQEELYWQAWIDGDIDGYLSLLHESFAGWASSLDIPGDKDAARQFFLNYIKQTGPSAYEMMPCAIKIVGDTAIVHYFLVWIDEHGNRIGDRFRITHTWIEKDGEWKVLGGMSSKIETT